MVEKEAFWHKIVRLLDVISSPVDSNFNSIGLTAAEEAKLNTAIMASDATLLWYSESHAQGGPYSIEYGYFTGNSGDHYIGTSGDDTYNGSSLGDIASAAAGHDTLYGHGGNDTLNGGHGDDTLFGGAGNDTLIGDAGNDIIYGGDGDDVIHDTHDVWGYWYESSDTFYGEAGDDIIAGGMGADFLYGGDGDDTIYGGIQPLAPAPSGTYGIGNYTSDYNFIDGGLGNDHLIGSQRDDIFVDGYGSFGQNLIDGGDGYNTFRIVGGGAEVWINSGAGVVEVPDAYADENDLTFEVLDNFLLIKGFISDNEVNIYVRHYGGYVNVDKIRFSSGYELDLQLKMHFLRGIPTEYDDVLHTIKLITPQSRIVDALAGDDIVYGHDGVDYIHGNLGNDILYGGGDNDTLHGDDGNDTLYGGDGDDQLSGWSGDDALYGDNGNDTLRGGVGNDTLHGGAGSDTLYGGADDDTYVFTAGDGEDTIEDGEGFDTIQFSGVSAEDVRIWTYYHSAPNVMRVEIKYGVSDVVKITAAATTQYGSEISTIRLGQIVFDDNTVWDMTAGLTMTGTSDGETGGGTQYGDIIYGLGGEDNLVGHGGDDSLYGGDGNDNLYGGEGNDLLDGGDGGDVLDAGNGNDTLNGGIGDDSLHGGTGDDTYIISAGDGDDVISDGSGNDVIRFVGVSAEEVRLWTYHFGWNNMRLDIFYGASDVVRISAGSTIPGGIEILSPIDNIIFDDNTVWDMTSGLTLTGTSSGEFGYGTQYGDTIYGLGGADYIYAHQGDDTVYGGDGNDEIYGGLGNNILHGDDGDDLIYGGENDIIYGGAGNDTLMAESGDDILNGGTGNDNLYGGIGSDTFVFTEGDGVDQIFDASRSDIIKLTGVSSEDVRVWMYFASSNYMRLELMYGDSDVVRILTTATNPPYGHELYSPIGSIVFDDNTVWDMTSGLTLTGTSSGEYGFGTEYGDTIYGLGGNDYLYAHRGDDTVYGGDGNDEIFGGLGNNILHGDDGDDLIYGGENDTIYGGAGNDTLMAESGDDILNGGTGNDNLYGGSGSDTFVFTEGDGVDQIFDASRSDIIKLTGVASEDVRVWMHFSHWTYMRIDVMYGDSDVIRILTSSSLQNSELYSPIGSIVFDDNTVWDMTSGLTLKGTDDGEYGFGTEYGDTIYGLGGNDYLYAHRGDDTVYGGDGNDEIFGGDGDDVIYGGNGADILYGGNGSDRFVFAEYNAHDADGVYDFSLVGGDQVDLSGLLNLYDPLSDNLSDYVSITESGGSSLIYVDRDGAAGSHGSVLVATLTWVTGLGTLASLVNNNTLIVSPNALSNRAPMAFDDIFANGYNAALLGNLLADNGLGADIDPDDDEIAVVAGSYTTVHGGTVVIANNGDFTYTSALDFVGEDSFTYTLRDEHGKSATATAYVTTASANAAPIAQDDVFTMVSYDHQTTLLNRNVFANNGYGADSDTDGDALFVVESSVTTALGRTVNIAADGTFSYINKPGYVGIDTFNYTISDGKGGTDTALVTITLTAPIGVIVGTSDDEILHGTSGNDWIYGLEGNDVIYGYNGTNYLYGWDGDDIIYGGDSGDYIYGGRGHDILSGGMGRDSYIFNTPEEIDGDIIEDNGNNTHVGMSGQDIKIYGVTSAPIIRPAENKLDLLIYVDGYLLTVKNQFSNDYTDKIYSLWWESPSGNGQMFLGGIPTQPKAYTFYGSEGNDTISMPLYGLWGAGLAHYLYGMDGDDVLTGAQNSTDYLYGGDGNDILYAKSAGQFNDRLYGGSGDDILYGSSVLDYLYGGQGADYLSGGAGADVYYFSESGEAEGDIIDDNGSSGNGNDLIQISNVSGLNFMVNDTDLIIWSELGTITVKNQYVNSSADIIERIQWRSGETGSYTDVDLTVMNFNGTSGDDFIKMPTYNAAFNGKTIGPVHGNDGDDTIIGGNRADVFYGGNGNDELSGMSGNDILYGDAGDDILFGGIGSDTLYGGDGNDVLEGGANADVLYGGAGADIFQFLTANITTSDTIADLSILDGDAIDISNLLFGYDPLTHVITDFVIFGTSGSDTTLSIDRDGTGGLYTAQSVALIQNVTGLDANAMLTNGNLIA
jgi:Ca2+-binding RTX toxin-like protein